MRIWQYEVATDRIPEFRRVYAHDGAWAQLFSISAGYLGTELFENAAAPGSFVTIDRHCSPQGLDPAPPGPIHRWRGDADWHCFRSEYEVTYRELDALCEQLTVSEVELAAITVPAPGP